jgi:LysR family transcriptional activator of nhaA
VNWLNFNHLRYFWTVARAGSVTAAAKELHLTQPAVSAQIRVLEDAVGERLFKKRGRGLVLTETGQLAFQYADEIFRLGRELAGTLRGAPGRGVLRFTVGMTDAMSKLIAYRLLQPALTLDPPTRLVLREDKQERLLADLSIHVLDLVLTDAPLAPQVKVQAYHHLIGETGISIFGTDDLVRSHRRRFPRSLDGAPFLLPIDTTSLYRNLHRWFDAVGVTPTIVAELEDSAVLKVFGAQGAGLFAAPTAIEDDVRRRYGVRVVGRTTDVIERFYAVTVDRKIKHPAVLAITNEARAELFA